MTTSLLFSKILVVLLWSFHVRTTLASGVEVICTGFMRTGTESLMEALGTLGYETYYTKKLLLSLSSYGGKHFEKWKYLVDTNCQTEDAKEVLKQMFEVDTQTTAVSYLGGLICLEQLLELYPDAKVVHTQRTSPELWMESFLEGPCSILPNINLAAKVFSAPKKASDFLVSFFNKILLGRNYPPFVPVLTEETCNAHQDALKEQYTRHNQNIHTRVPPERFLNFAKPELESLTNFLGKEIPASLTKYPHSNTRKEFRRGAFMIFSGAFVFMSAGVLLVIAVALGMRRRRKAKKE